MSLHLYSTTKTHYCKCQTNSSLMNFTLMSWDFIRWPMGQYLRSVISISMVCSMVITKMGSHSQAYNCYTVTDTHVYPENILASKLVCHLRFFVLSAWTWIAELGSNYQMNAMKVLGLNSSQPLGLEVSAVSIPDILMSDDLPCILECSTPK